MKAFVLSVAFVATSSNASFLSGNRLYEMMRSANNAETALAIGYVMAAHDVGEEILHCSPKSVTSGQIRDMVRLYMERNPEERSKAADTIILNVLAGTWPCPTKKGSSL